MRLLSFVFHSAVALFIFIVGGLMIDAPLAYAVDHAVGVQRYPLLIMQVWPALAQSVVHLVQ